MSCPYDVGLLVPPVQHKHYFQTVPSFHKGGYILLVHLI